MKTQNMFLLLLILFLGFLLVFLNSCEKEKPPTIITLSVTEITSNSAKSGGNITSDGGAAVTARGVIWSTSADLSVNNYDGITTDGAGSGTFISSITDLSPGTLYYLKAYATNDNGHGYGNQHTFTTPGAAPAAITQQATGIITESAVLNAMVYPNYLETTVIFEYGLTEDYGNEVVAEQSPIEGSANVSVSAFIDDLTPRTTYHFRVRAENAFGVNYGNNLSFTTYSDDDLQDIDGNYYRTVIIDNKEWMAENLKTTHYRNGTPIENPTSNSDWQNNNTGAYVWYDNDISWKDSYGALYNWFAVNNTNGLCPAGWGVPSDAEWIKLRDYLVSSAGGKLKSTRTEPELHPRWDSPNVGATNESGFTGLPASQRMYHGGFSYLPGYHASIWTSTEEYPGSEFAWSRFLTHYSNGLQPYIGSRKRSGRSVRCLREVDN